MDSRKSGILLHLTSLPSQFGIGDMGQGAYEFVDFLKKSKQSYWQMLPLNPTDFINGNSPYSSQSAFACNMLLLSPEALVKKGYLSKKDIPNFKQENPNRVDYKKAAEFKEKMLDTAFNLNLKKIAKDKKFSTFCSDNKYWLDDYAMFCVIKQKNDMKMWTEWDDKLKNRDKKTIDKIAKESKEDILKVKFQQYLFYEQWTDLKQYANKCGVKIIGDIPIYVNFDSVDVWTYSDMFKLDENKQPIFVAGVPPDYFSETGQRWGNPVYDWQKMKDAGFSWWVDRIRRNLALCDVVRIDHFRGLINYWEIPINEETAINGHWQDVPTDDFFNALRNKFPGLPLIAEDLGMLTDDVKEAIRRLGFPGMKILMFAFGGNLNENPYIPNNFDNNSVIYTGTHDNNTVHGWFNEDAKNEEKSNLINYLNREVSITQLHWEMIDIAMRSNADLSIIPLQDFLGLGADARMNTPSTVGDNWQWRYLPEVLQPELASRIANLTKETGRI